MSNTRADRVADQIRAELGKIFLTELRDPRVKLATASNVRVSRDLSHADVFISSLADDEQQRKETIEGLERAAGFIRRTLASRLSLRRVPELHFALDRGAEHSRHITDLLSELEVSDDSDEVSDDGGSSDEIEAGDEQDAGTTEQR